MEAAFAKDLINAVFSKRFEMTSFVNFANKLLYSATFNSIHVPVKSISEQYKDHIDSLEILSTFNDCHDNKIDVLVVKLLKDTSLDKARTMQRNFIAQYLDSSNKDAALIAFVYPKQKNWRFSLIKLETVFSGINLKTVVTPARRWSFLVGENEGSHTAQSQLLEILTNDKAPDLKELEDAFDIETVTKEFFDAYTNLFLKMKSALEELINSDINLKEDFENKEVDISDFAKKTMGQISFLYFLQKKGWFGVLAGKKWGSGVKNFLREIYKKRNKYGKNFFNDLLEPLFYEALAKDRSDKGDIYPKLNNCRVPFLNGGLFEPINNYDWKKTNITLPDELFSNQNETKEGDKGDGILDVFDRYNFTVNESDPLDQEVAVDPEMLGKVFENLLGKEERGDEGTFYTPRPIVQYMCQESLINYLSLELGKKINKNDIQIFIKEVKQITENDKSILLRNNKEISLALPKDCIENADKLDSLLANVKVCDPAVGSGAFPVSMLNEIVSARKLLNLHLKNDISIYELKYHAIANSLYGVDLDPGAVEIAKLRFWLSLVVEEETPTPLPNLEYKIMQGNSLLSTYRGIDLFDDNFLINAESIEIEKAMIKEKLDELTQMLPDLYGDGFNSSRKIEIKEKAKKLRKKLNSIERKATKESENINLFNNKETLVIAHKKINELHAKMAQYISADNKDNREKLKLKIDSLEWDLIEINLIERGEHEKLSIIKKQRKDRIKPFFVWKLEFGEVFKENKGFDIVVANPPYNRLDERINNGTGLNRGDIYKDENYETFAKRGNIYALFYELGIKILKPKGHLNYITSNKWMQAGYGHNLRNYFIKYNPINLIDFGGFKVFDSATVDVNVIKINKEKNSRKLKACRFKNDFKKGGDIARYFKKNAVEINDLDYKSWFIGNKNEISLKKKIEKIGTPLENWDIKITCGVKTGLNKAFVIDKDTRDKLISCNPDNEQIIKPLLRGKDIKRNACSFKNNYLIFVKYKSHPHIKEKHPEIYQHLESYKEELKNRGQCKNNNGKGQHHWLELDNNPTESYMEKFHCEKIMYPEMSSEASFYYDEKGFFCNNKGFIISGSNLKYLIACLNSRVTHRYLKMVCSQLGDAAVEYRKIYIKNFPIPEISSSNKLLADQIEDLMEKKIKDKNNDLDQEIDELVYKLYQLNEEEIKTIKDTL